MLDAIGAAWANGARIAGICTGAFALAETGPLDGRHATTHWLAAAAIFARCFPKVLLDPEVLFVDEERVVHAHRGGDRTACGGDRGVAEHACASARSDALGRWPRLAVGGGHLDTAPETDAEVETQLLSQHPIQLLVAEATVGHDAHADTGGLDVVLNRLAP